MVNPIKIHRMSIGVTQAELARRVGTSRQMVHVWESSDAIPTDHWIPKLAAVFGVKPIDFAREVEQARVAFVA